MPSEPPEPPAVPLSDSASGAPLRPHDTPPNLEQGSLRQAMWQALRGHIPDVATSDLRRAIPLLALPMALESAMEALFVLVDMLLVARLGPAAVATLGLTESIIACLYALAFGMAAPATAMVARRSGEGNPAAVAEAANQSFWLAIMVGSGGALLACWSAPLLQLLGAEAEVLAIGTPFMTISLCMGPIITTLFVLSGVLRGVGNPAMAMRGLAVANITNLLLDPCLIFGLGPFPALGVTGAAIATFIGRGSGALFLLVYLCRGPIAMPLWPLKRAAIARKLLRLALGGAAQHLVETGSWLFLVRILATFGSAAVAGYTIAMRIVLFTLLPTWGLSNATGTLVGQSLGAGNPARAAKAVWLSGWYTSAALGSCAGFFLLRPDLPVALFSPEPAVAHVAQEGVRIISCGYVFYGWQMVTQQAFNGAGDTRTPALINLMCFWLLQVPGAYLLCLRTTVGTAGIFWAITVSYTVSALVSVLLVRRGRWQQVHV